MRSPTNNQFTVISIAVLAVLVLGFFAVRAFDAERAVAVMVVVVLAAFAGTFYFARSRRP